MRSEKTENTMLNMDKIRKHFGELIALNEVDFSLKRGEIHGLLGENGAGKSTLMNILYGLYRADSGEICLEGEKVHFLSPLDSIKNGIGMVHQVSTLVPSYTAFENIIIGPEENKYNQEAALQKVRSICETYSFDFPLDTKVERLGIDSRQKIEIVRALYRRAKILVLDEPTTSLIESEVENLKNAMRALASQGISIIFITHKIREVLDICDRATVLRKGNVEGHVDIKNTSKENLVSLMFMEKDIEVTDSALPFIELKERKEKQTTFCRMKDVVVPGKERSPGLRKMSLDVHRGEILGIAGVSGNGQKELALALINPPVISGGELIIDGKNFSGMKTLTVFQQGIAYTPEDRMKEAVLPDGTLVHNMLLHHFGEAQFRKQKIFIDWKKAKKTTAEMIRNFNIMTPDEKTKGRKLSGGNLQKVVLGRALINPIKMIIVDNPCSGLDISTVEMILNKLVQIRDQGNTVIWINEDLDELMLCSDRIAVMYEGRIAGIVERKNFNKLRIGELMAGGKDEGENS